MRHRSTDVICVEAEQAMTNSSTDNAGNFIMESKNIFQEKDSTDEISPTQNVVGLSTTKKIQPQKTVEDIRCKQQGHPRETGEDTQSGEKKSSFHERTTKEDIPVQPIDKIQDQAAAKNAEELGISEYNVIFLIRR